MDSLEWVDPVDTILEHQSRLTVDSIGATECRSCARVANPRLSLTIPIQSHLGFRSIGAKLHFPELPMKLNE